jgi:putative endonuclease
MHESGRGARYTRGRAPLTLVYRQRRADRSAALKREHAIKQLSREEKEELIAQAHAAAARQKVRARQRTQQRLAAPSPP